MREHSERFLKNLFGALAHCIFEELGCAVPAAACVFIVCVFYIFFLVGYELVFDPNANDVATRLAGISISPEKWM
jgi:hypothetical protein